MVRDEDLCGAKQYLIGILIHRDGGRFREQPDLRRQLGQQHGVGCRRRHSEPLQFVPLTPCRVVDTRQAPGPFGGPQSCRGGYAQLLPSAEHVRCTFRDGATYSLNVTVVPEREAWDISRSGRRENRSPPVSTLNSPDGRVKANAAIVPAGAGGAVSVYVSDTTNVMIDIDGYFTAAEEQTLQFYPLSPCRVLDTRKPDGHLGGPYLPALASATSPCSRATARSRQTRRPTR